VANTYFQFKQFIVHQEQTAMKVCTDACLFGAWVANDISILNNDSQKTINSIVDIGTGTGLLSLMLAQATSTQTNPAKITGIEIEPNAASEAETNFKASPWNDRIELIQDSVQNFTKTHFTSTSINSSDKTSSVEKFDCVITNPPFFEGDLHSPDAQKNLASHSTALPWDTLMKEVKQLLNEDGYYYVLVPALRAYTMQKLASQNELQLMEEIVVYNAAKQKPFRVIQKYINSSALTHDIKRSNFIIKNENNEYTKEFIKLLAPYYLHL
jgi:tRNA1Val (adenine37-N6)-methyltransferase